MIGASEADISPSVAVMAATLVRLAHVHNENLHNALNKAEVRLFTHAWSVSGGILRIESDSNVGNFRLTDGDKCECPTRKYICWHRAAWMILSVLAAANIAPLKSENVPLASRGPVTPEESELDDIDAGNFLDRPELAPVIHDEWYVKAAEVYARYYERAAGDPKRASNAQEFAYGAAFQCALQLSASDSQSHEIAGKVMGDYVPQAARAVPHHMTPLAPTPDTAIRDYLEQEQRLGHRSRMQDAEIEKRRKLADIPRDRPEEYLWDTSDYSEEETEEKIVSQVKETPPPPPPFRLRPARIGALRDPFEEGI